MTQKPKMLHLMANLGRGNSNPGYLGRAVNKKACGHTTLTIVQLWGIQDLGAQTTLWACLNAHMIGYQVL